MKGSMVLLILAVYSLGEIEKIAAKEFLRGELVAQLEATEVETQGSDLENSGNVNSEGALNEGNETDTTESSSQKEEEPDTLIYGIIIDVVVVVLILAFILYQVIAKKTSKPEGQAYSRVV